MGATMKEVEAPEGDNYTMSGLAPNLAAMAIYYTESQNLKILPAGPASIQPL